MRSTAAVTPASSSYGSVPSSKRSGTASVDGTSLSGRSVSSSAGSAQLPHRFGCRGHDDHLQLDPCLGSPWSDDQVAAIEAELVQRIRPTRPRDPGLDYEGVYWAMYLDLVKKGAAAWFQARLVQQTTATGEDDP